MESRNNLFGCVSYATPSCKVVGLKARRVMCLSEGDLEKGNYGNQGYAGQSTGEDDGGNLFGGE